MKGTEEFPATTGNNEEEQKKAHSVRDKTSLIYKP